MPPLPGPPYKGTFQIRDTVSHAGWSESLWLNTSDFVVSGTVVRELATLRLALLTPRYRIDRIRASNPKLPRAGPADEIRRPGTYAGNGTVLRDLDLLGPMAAQNLVHVNISITTLDPALARAMEPRASTPAARLRAVRELSAAGVPVRMLIAPVVPGLTDAEIPALLAAAKEAGAHAAGYTLLRLPLAVAPVFMEWLGRAWPDGRARVERLVRDTRAGRLNDSRFGRRMCGTGEYADVIGRVFEVFARRHGLDGGLPPYDCSQFQPPPDANGQGRLF